MDKVRIGIVGTGFIAPFHYNGFIKNENADVVGICSTNGKSERLTKIADNWNIKAYENFAEIVSDPNIDALIIGSTNPAHYSHILKAIENKKHVLVEKPVVTEISQVDEIQKAAQDNNVCIFPAHNFVYRGAVQMAKEIMDSGKIGNVLYSSNICTHTISDDHRNGWRGNLSISKGGALMDSGHHLVYQELFLRGMPVKLQAFKSNLVLNNMEGEDIAQLNLLYSDNSMGHIMQSWTSKWDAGVNGLRIFGEQGNLVLTDALYWNSDKVSTDVDYGDSFGNQAKAFTDYILKGVKPLSTLEDVKNTLRIIYDAYESSNANTVKVY